MTISREDDLLTARFRLTPKELKRIRNAFEVMNPHARQWRRDGKDDCEYFGPMREPFLAFRDGWCAGTAAAAEAFKGVAEDRVLYGSGFAMITTGGIERISPERIMIKPESSDQPGDD